MTYAMLVTASPSFRAKGVAGQLAIQLAAGQVVAVILPVGQTHRAVDLKQGGSLALSISLIRVVSYWPEAAVTTVTGTPVSFGVLSGQILPILILLRL